MAGKKVADAIKEIHELREHDKYMETLKDEKTDKIVAAMNLLIDDGCKEIDCQGCPCYNALNIIQTPKDAKLHSMCMAVR